MMMRVDTGHAITMTKVNMEAGMALAATMKKRGMALVTEEAIIRHMVEVGIHMVGVRNIRTAEDTVAGAATTTPLVLSV
ncbi:hypothetical protein BN14_02291 [Rhizoctonia solani AG-1 IB]|uniref:Uncharacterized protein n=1 Tax=Thanatephorus cucumeris (strain AG1-IB / isolate 7/3/14) TaxID=1108050 RepID=M5BMX7_THACB|nr:hypothetical protein BN14_02291 [Rhizoctonia solani AG-1 IB]